jgi:Fic family protein
MKFFNNLDSDLRTALQAQLRDLWTHTSTAIEGNTLTLGETKFVIEEGLTVSGKPLKDHSEVVGHARALDLIYAMAAMTKLKIPIYSSCTKPSCPKLLRNFVLNHGKNR